MSEESNAGKGLGIAGMILGIVGVICAFIPCMELWAILLCIVGIVLSAVSLSKAKKGNGPKGMGKAGLILSIIGTVVAIVKYVILITALSAGASAFGEAIQSDEFKDAIQQGLENAAEQAEELEEGH